MSAELYAIPDNPFAGVTSRLISAGFQTSTSDVQRMQSHAGGHAGWIVHIWGSLPQISDKPRHSSVDVGFPFKTSSVSSVHASAVRPARRNALWQISNCEIINIDGEIDPGFHHHLSIEALEQFLKPRRVTGKPAGLQTL